MKYVVAVLAMRLCLPVMGADKDKPLPKDLKSLAEKGDARAQNNLGAMYARGEGVEKEAVKWYRNAGEQGHADGQIPNIVKLCGMFRKLW